MTTPGLNRNAIADYTNGSFDPDARWQVIGFSDMLMSDLARKINIWSSDHPEWAIFKIHHSGAGGDDYQQFSALVEIRRAS